MAFVRTVPVDQTTGEVRAMHERNQARLGYVPNYAKAFSHRPRLWTAWETLSAGVDRCPRYSVAARRGRDARLLGRQDGRAG